VGALGEHALVLRRLLRLPLGADARELAEAAG
jgi:hypothetical protein